MICYNSECPFLIRGKFKFFNDIFNQILSCFWLSFEVVTNMDLALPKTHWTMDLQGPTGHIAACDWTQTKRMSQDLGWWLDHHSFPSFIEALRASPPSLIKSPRRLPQDPAGIPSCFYQGIPPRVMILRDLMALVLRIKSIGQWPFTWKLVRGWSPDKKHSGRWKMRLMREQQELETRVYWEQAKRYTRGKG